MRKLASIQVAKEVIPHPNADSLDIAKINGWNCIVKKDEFKTGDLGVYFEIDSFLPLSDERYANLHGPTAIFEGVEGRRIKTIKLRSEVSQGLLLPLSLFEKEIQNIDVGTDVSELLDIVKFEKPMPIYKDAIAFMPSHVDKTEQDRIQNLPSLNTNGLWEMTEKFEGCSLTIFHDLGVFNVCSKNLVIKESSSSALWEMAYKYNIRERLLKYGRNIAIQGEMVGPNVEDNIYKLESYRYYVYTVFDMDQKRKLLPAERKQVIDDLNAMEGKKIETVPILGYITIPEEENWMDQLLSMADGFSQLNSAVRREGLVFQHTERNVAFKAISNLYLLKQK